MGRFTGLLKYSTKIYGYDQAKVFHSYELDSPRPNPDILNHCERGTCAALAARWAFERANSKCIGRADRMFPTTYTSKSGYARSKRPGQVDPERMKKIEEVRKASERFHGAYPTGMSLEEWRGQINQLADEDIEKRLKDDRLKMKQKLQKKQFAFYEKVAEMQVAYKKKSFTWDDPDNDGIGFFVEKYVKTVPRTDDRGVGVAKVGDTKRAEDPRNAGDEDSPIGGRGNPNHLLGCLKDVEGTDPIYVGMKVMLRANMEEPDWGGHSIALEKQNEAVRFFDPNAGDYLVSDKNWKNFVDAYARILSADPFGWHVMSVTTYRVKLMKRKSRK